MKRTAERRSYFRINDTIGLSYSKLNEGDTNRPSHYGEIDLTVTNVLAGIDMNFNQAINILWRESPTVAKALGLLNDKISLIAAHSLQAQDLQTEPYEELTVNLSGCGMGFQCEEMLDVQSRLLLSVVLKPSNIHLELTATVIACETLPADADKPYWLRISIDPENATAQEQLIQHIVQKQCAQPGVTQFKAPS